MLTKINTPLGNLSRVKDFDLDLSLKGKHIELLSPNSGMDEKHAVLEVLKDLSDGKIDVYNLTSAEMYYAFLLVKVTSISPKIKFTTRCPHMVKTSKGSIVDCGFSNKVEYNFVESDVNRCPKDFEIPTITFPDDESKSTYRVLPLSMNLEFILDDYFVEQGYNLAELKNPDCSFAIKYAMHRNLLHLVGQNGNDFSDNALRESYVQKIQEYPISFIVDLNQKISEVSQFGIQNRVINVTCKGCGATFRTAAGLKSGLSV